MASLTAFFSTTHRRVVTAPVELQLFVFALAIRMLYLGSEPLWLDEFIVSAVGLGGPGAFFRFSTMTPHPPLYYLLQYAFAGFGNSNAEIAWRWLPALCGAATIPLIYALARHVASQRSALIVSLLAAVLPTHVYFSQESRPYAFLTLLAALSTLALERAQRLGSRRAFYLVVALWVVGVSSGYSFGAVVVVQLLWIFTHWRAAPRMLGVVIGIALFGAFLVALAYQPMLQIARRAEVSGAVLTLSDLANTLLLLDPLRYGSLWGHFFVPGLLIILIGIGAWDGAVVRRLSVARLYTLQLLIPLAGVFIVLDGVLGMKMPIKDAKQFIVLLPAAFGLLAAGLERVSVGRARRRDAVFVGLCLSIILLAYGTGLGRYWTTAKSPEGRVVKAVIGQQRADDTFVVMHYSLSAAFSFYQPDTTYFSQHQRCANERALTYGRFDGLTAPLPDCTHSLNTIVEAHRRVWLLTAENSAADLRPVFDARCARQQVYTQQPFQALLYECPAR